MSDEEPLILWDETHKFLPPSNHWSPPAMDFNVPVVRFHSARRYGKQSTVEAWEELGRAWQRLTDEIAKVFDGPVTQLAEKLRDAGLIEDPGPTDPKERALWARQHRNTGPTRPSGQNAHPPRRHK